MHRLRKIDGAVDEDGNVVSIPRLPAITGTAKPLGWDHWPPHEKLDHLLDMMLDRMREYLSWPAGILTA
jgi:hypothetical protein